MPSYFIPTVRCGEVEGQVYSNAFLSYPHMRGGRVEGQWCQGLPILSPHSEKWGVEGQYCPVTTMDGLIILASVMVRVAREKHWMHLAFSQFRASILIPSLSN
jgi:hypothetical protein